MRGRRVRRSSSSRGATTYGGRWVVNPSGGLISKGHPLGATGLAQAAELVWQLRGEAGAAAGRGRAGGARAQHRARRRGGGHAAAEVLGLPGPSGPVHRIPDVRAAGRAATMTPMVQARSDARQPLVPTTTHPARAYLGGGPRRVRRAVPRRPRRVRRQCGAAVDAGRPGAERRRACSGWSTPTPSPSPGSCCSAGGPRTSTAASGCSSSGSALFTAASLAGGLAQEGWQLLVARAVQGLGAAVLAPATLTILTAAVPRGRGPDPGDRHLDGGGRGGRRGGRARRRGAHRPAVLALGAADQRAGRRAGAGRRGRCWLTGEPGRRGDAAPRSTCRARCWSRPASRPSRTASCRPRQAGWTAPATLVPLLGGLAAARGSSWPSRRARRRR